MPKVLPDALQKNRLIIEETLQTSNEETFSPKNMQIQLLKNCPETIPTLANWIYQEWHPYDSSLTKQKLITGFGKRLNDDRIPLAVVVLKEGLPIGTISLKENEDPEFANFAVGNPWLGSFQITEAERNKGLGTDLLKMAKTLAIGLGYKNIFLYTSNPANLEWFSEHGVHLIETRPFRNHEITIMQIHLS